MPRACLAVLVIPSLLVALATPAEAQTWGRFKARTQDKVAQRKARLDSAAVRAADRAVDSTLEKSARGVDTTVAVVSDGIDTTLNRTERGVARLASPRDVARDRARRALAAGRLSMDTVGFREGDAEPDAAGQRALRTVAQALREVAGVFLVEAAPAPDGGAAPDLPALRAGAVKRLLVAAGVPAARLFVLGGADGATDAPAAPGAATPPAAAAAPSVVVRVTLTRMQ